MRDLFDPFQAGAKTQFATDAVFDAPLGDEENGMTLGDYYATAQAAPGWEPALPDATAKKRLAAEWVAELTQYLADRFGKTARERDVIKARLGGWTYDQIAKCVLGGCPMETARSMVRKLMKRIRDGVNRLGEKDELYGMWAGLLRVRA